MYMDAMGYGQKALGESHHVDECSSGSDQECSPLLVPPWPAFGGHQVGQLDVPPVDRDKTGYHGLLVLMLANLVTRRAQQDETAN